jgi:hypothetical protein
MSFATLQGLVKNRLTQWSLERWIVLFIYFFSFVVFLWGISPWMAHRDFLNFSVPQVSKADGLIVRKPFPIEQAHLFGIYVQDYAHLPMTALPLALEGTLLNPSDPNLSSAIIRESGQGAKIMYVNDQMEVGAKIIAIYDDYCVLDHGGRLEKLIIPRVPLQNLPAAFGPSEDSGLEVVP